MVRIFSNRIRIRFGLEGFLSIRIQFRVFNIRNRFVSEYLKVTFLWCRYPLQFYPEKLTIFISNSIFEHKYKNKYNVSDPFISLFIELRYFRLNCSYRLNDLRKMYKGKEGGVFLLMMCSRSVLMVLSVRRRREHGLSWWEIMMVMVFSPALDTCACTAWCIVCWRLSLPGSSTGGPWG